MAKPFKRRAESWVYILEGDRALSADQQTRFILRPLTQAEQMAIEDEVYYLSFDADGRKSHVTREKRVARQLALSHIESIENFPPGNPKPWPADPEARDRYLAELQADDVHEVGNEIFKRSKLGYAAPDEAPKDGDVIKNSSPPAPTSGSGGTSEATTTVPTG